MGELQRLYDRIVACTECDLCKGRTRAVPGEGPENAEIMFVGEGPGLQEDQQGRPFIGPAGRLLERLLASIRLTRQEVYIANVVKCRPPGNRDPVPAEIGACRKYLEQQIELIEPKLIVTLGRHSLAWFLPSEKIGRVHGQVKNWKGLQLMPLYHPAAALHAASMRQVIQEDFKKLLPALDRVRRTAGHPSPSNPQPKQMSLF